MSRYIVVAVVRCSCACSRLPVRQALAGRFRPHQAFLVGQLLGQIDYLDEAISEVSTKVEGPLAPFAAELTRLDTIPGISRRTATVIIAELGVDMSFFPSERHVASWVGLGPGNNESAGKAEERPPQLTLPELVHMLDSAFAGHVIFALYTPSRLPPSFGSAASKGSIGSLRATLTRRQTMARRSASGARHGSVGWRLSGRGQIRGRDSW